LLHENPNAAPGDLELVRNFVNTLDIESGYDQLATPADLLRWLSTNGLVDQGEDGAELRAASKVFQRAIQLREGLRLELAAHDDEKRPARTALSAAARDLKLLVEFGPDGPALVAAEQGPAAGLATLLGIVHAAAVDGTWERLKVCENEDCQWAYYDHSRNRSGKWCAMAVCGNRMKARTYRRRRAA
jgi:predicted RNA-binding Zn ribbon-like protein